MVAWARYGGYGNGRGAGRRPRRFPVGMAAPREPLTSHPQATATSYSVARSRTNKHAQAITCHGLTGHMSDQIHGGEAWSRPAGLSLRPLP